MTSTIATPGQSPTQSARSGVASWLSALPGGLLLLLLLLATWFDGAFALRHWGPVAILAIAVSAAAAFSGVIRSEERWVKVAAAALFVLAGWSVLSAVWADSPDRALTGGARSLLYASLFFVAVATPARAQVAQRLGGAAIAGVTAIAAITLVLLLGDGTGQFLAGRLDDPVGYRNATACLFALAFWPLVCVAAPQTGNPVVRASAASGALLMVGLALLTQARGTAVGLALGGVVVLGLGPDRLRRFWIALLAGGAIAAISDRLLTPYDAFTDGRAETAADIATAVEALAMFVVIGFAAALALALLDGGLRMGARTRARVRRLAIVAAVGAAILASGATLAAIGNPASFAGDRLDEFRSLETAAPGETRLTFGGGQRSDLWRIALREFADNPVGGVGEGSYQFRYYEERRTDRNLSTAHGLPFDLVAEKGLVGTLAFVAFIVAVGAGVARRWGDASPEGRRWSSGLLAASTVVLGQSVVDWIWLVPGVTGIGFLCAGLGLAALGPSGRGARPEARRRPLALMAGTLLSLALVGVTLLYVSDVSVRMARGGAPAQERLDAAERAESLNPYALAPRYLQAGLHEELGRPARARSELRGALELEPNNFATLALLGDLEFRRGRRRQAAAYYRRASRLNPRDVGLRKLVRRAAG